MATHAALTAGALDGLAGRLEGRLVRPGEEDYDDVRAVFNAMIDRRPAAIARCRDASDVAHGIAFARDHDLPLSVRGGGHSVAGNGTVDGQQFLSTLDEEYTGFVSGS